PLIAGELGNAVQDAFVIAVEQQARERLQRLSALKRITPVDMSQLSIKASIPFGTQTPYGSTIAASTARPQSGMQVNVSTDGPMVSSGSAGGYANVRQSFGPTGTASGAFKGPQSSTGSDGPQPATNNNNTLALSAATASGSASAYHLHHSLVNNNNLTSNIGKPQGLDSTANSYYSNLTNTFLANGHGSKRELATLSEGELEPQDEPQYESSGNISRGGTEVLLGDQNLRQENRWI
uniref:Uncharacterized protein n=1 Tax=Anopheles maculatus TaxID=74869 RepID=A0A182SBK8_9DIPT